jgi:uncharacterized protein (TIGR02466 family)
MAIKNYDIQPLFAEAYARADIGFAISDKQIAYLKNLKMVRNRVNLISENLYILDQPELRTIKEAIHEALDLYANKVMGISQKLYVTQSWSLINDSNVGMHGHSHSNSIISGSLYYCDMPSPVARMIFDRHKSYQQLELNPDDDKKNIYNAPMNIVTPKKNDVILFPSSLQHFVEVNSSSEPRYSLAFNSFIKGKLGDYRDVSELEL